MLYPLRKNGVSNMITFTGTRVGNSINGDIDKRHVSTLNCLYVDIFFHLDNFHRRIIIFLRRKMDAILSPCIRAK